MATKKLTASLRNSITAEKNSLDTKSFQVNEKAKIEVLASNSAAIKPAKATVTSASQAKKAPTNEALKQVVNNFFGIQPVDSSAKKKLAELAEVSAQFSSIYLQSLQTANFTFNQYLKKIVEVKDLAAIYSANLEFLSELGEVQQNLFIKNKQLFKQARALMLPSLKIT